VKNRDYHRVQTARHIFASWLPFYAAQHKIRKFIAPDEFAAVAGGKILGGACEAAVADDRA
jgi:hypothetical protein